MRNPHCLCYYAFLKYSTYRLIILLGTKSNSF
nr:MAG TPA: hypothetical protein [Caudoviricetes sp.]